MNGHNLPKSLIDLVTKQYKQNTELHDLRESFSMIIEAVTFSTAQMEVVASAIAGIAGIDAGGSPQATIKRAIQVFFTKTHTPEGWRLFGKMINMFIDANIPLQGVLANCKLPTLKAIGVISGYKNPDDTYSFIIGNRDHVSFDAQGGIIEVGVYGEEMGAVLDIPSAVAVSLKDYLSQY